MKLAVVFDDLALRWGPTTAVCGLSGSVDRGSLTAVVGPNGAGKSTLLAALAGRVRPAAGRLEVAADLRRRTAWLPQRSTLDRRFPMTVGDAVMSGAWQRLGAWRAPGPALRDEAARALETVGLSGAQPRQVGALSAGQLQRVLFARLLMQDAALILLDEPFNGMDAATTADLLALVGRWHREGRTVVAVLHDMQQVQGHFSATLHLAPAHRPQEQAA